jgi:probable rRNA maturation factor
MQSQTSGNLSITRTTKGKLPGLPFVRVKNEILGRDFQLSLAFIDISTMKKLSKEYKGTMSHTNILTFPLSANEAEIVMNLQTIRSVAKNYNMKYNEHLLFLFIHGCLHLKGYKHGPEMESLEERIWRKYLK